MRGTWFLILIAACSNRLDPVETGVIPNVESDADTDADTDTDTDTDADTDTDPRLDCAAVYDTPVPGTLTPDTCVTERVYCGDVRFGTTEGGTEIYDYDYWFDNQAIGNMSRSDVAGAERIYTIESVLPGQFVRVTVESCDDTRASWYLSGDLTPFCSTDATNTPKEHFYGVIGRVVQDTVLQNNTSASVYNFQIMVDAAVDANTNYMITFDCGDVQN